MGASVTKTLTMRRSCNRKCTARSKATAPCDDTTSPARCCAPILPSQREPLSWICSRLKARGDTNCTADAQQATGSFPSVGSVRAKVFEINSNQRSRTVACQLKAGDLSGQLFFALSPPLEMLRAVANVAATHVDFSNPDLTPHCKTRAPVGFVIMKRVYSKAPIGETTQQIYTDLPREDTDHGHTCKRLLHHM